MRLLITGARGQLGSELKRCLESGKAEIGPIPYDLTQAHVDYVDRGDLDITDGDAVQAFFKEYGPYDAVINCAAYTNVDGCEAHEEDAYAVNAIGVENLARAIDEFAGKLIHVSTDYVFPGTDEVPRCETDEVGPLSAYGSTKLAGEKLALQNCSRTFIVRTSWLYGYVGKNFVKTMIGLAQKNGAIAVVADQVGNPTHANDLAYELLKLSMTENYGIYHCTGEGVCSWFDFASMIVDKAGIGCTKEPLTSSEYAERFPGSARRPAYSGLENAHLRETIGNEMRPWQDALESYLAHAASLSKDPAIDLAI